ncbi:hypothetical protein [Nocardioides alkalitolerans]|uniref:hypothetical protein n=1 Tax=Nocardioides alkalitolerans TaxID=281714 RepID=UPI0004241454|nr:hypothetical protein [Nocardioides alkalitolerans]
MSSPEQPLFLLRSASRAAEIGVLAQRYGGSPGLGALLADLPRHAHRTLVPRLVGSRVAAAWGWDAADRRTTQWWPQGITTVSDAVALGERPAGLGDRRIVVATWYAKEVPGPDGPAKHGVRLSFLDLDARRYRHVLLVKPVTRDDGEVGFDPVHAHAGGIVWSGSWLHVAATGKGFVSAHLDDLVRLPEAPQPGHGDSFGHRWVLPTRVDHRAGVDKDAAGTDAVPRLRYSFLGLDRTSTPPALLVGEYGRGTATTRLARFALGPDGLPAGTPDTPRLTRPTTVVDTGVRGMQGIASVDGALHATTSHGPWGPGSLYDAAPGADGAAGTLAPTRRAMPMGPEDLTWWPESGRLWTVTEHPRRRWVVALRPS